MARKALLVGIGDYTDPRFRNMRSPKQDVRGLESLLRDPEVGGFSEVRVVEEAGYDRIRRELDALLSDARVDDLVLVYFSCHGVLTQKNRLVFAASDTDMKRLATTGVTASFVHELLEESNAGKKVVILDCCHSGAFANKKSSNQKVDIEGFFRGGGTYILTASLDIEYAYEDNEMVLDQPTPSRFTGLLLQGMQTGAADFDSDGFISMQDIHNYVSREIARIGADPRPRQSRVMPVF